MHKNAPFWGNFQKIGRTPTLPLLALRTSEAEGLDAPGVLNCAPEEKKVDNPDKFMKLEECFIYITLC